tara:strand:+ start:1066 stop:2088 length:1023 start_codon:yes stop_codon:yes gene_type:complete
MDKKENEMSLILSDSESTNGNSTTPVESKKKIEWSPENELILVEWCDAAQCYKWLHARSHVKYSYLHAWYTIPAIILSTISGTASFATSSLPANMKTLAPIAIGSLNIFIGILTTIQQYLKISELNESHRVMSIAWDKYARNIRIELSKAPDERSDASSFLKYNRQEFDRLMETSPPIDKKIIDEFINTFKGREGSEQRLRYEKLRKPDICNIIVSAIESRHHWYLELENNMDDDTNILVKQKKLADKETALSEKEHQILENQIKKDNARKSFITNVEKFNEKYNKEKTKIEDYINSFLSLYGRKPMKDEINKYMSTYNKEIISKETVDTFLKDYGNDMV